MNKRQVQKREISLDFHTYGKMAPQAREIEEAVLGAILLQKGAYDEVSSIITEKVFYVDAHRFIFQAMQSLAAKAQPIDLLTVSEELRKKGTYDLVGGGYVLTKLTNQVVSSANIESHSRIIVQKYIQREIITVGGYLVSEAYEEHVDVFELLDLVEERVYHVTDSLHQKTYEAMDTLLVKSIRRIEERRKKQEALTGVPSGFSTIDKLTHGWQNSDLIILAARPSVGKTALALNLARNAALDPYKPTPTALFSLEMSEAQLMDRLISSESEIHYERIQKGRLEESDMKILYTQAIQKLSQAQLFIDDTATMNIFELRAKCRRLKNQHDVGLIIIDYLQLMNGSGNRANNNREQEISEISRGLKQLAKELEVPIIALSQLSREVEKRKENKRPMLSDLRESGAIEQDADVVMFLYRPEYYSIQKDDKNESTVGLTEVNFAKHRSGALDTIKLQAKLWIQKFVPFTEYRHIQPGKDVKQLAGNDLWGRANTQIDDNVDFGKIG